MERIDRLIIRAEEMKHPPATKLELYIKGNKYIGMDRDYLLNLLSEPRCDDRDIMCALAWNGGGGDG